MDIDNMVKELMKAERMPMNKLTQQKQLLEWKRDDYRDLNRLLTDFRNLSFDMTLQRTYSQKKVSSTNPMVSATASSTAANATYTISDVKVATAYSISSIGFSKTDEQDPPKSLLDPSKSIWEQKDLFEKWGTTPEDSTFTITTYNASGQPIEDTFTLNASTTMNDLMSKISSSNIGVTAFYDETTGELMLTRKEAGSLVGEDGAIIKFTGPFLTDVLELDKGKEVGGSQAELTINGVTTTRPTNSFSVNGVNFTLNGDMEGQTAVVSIGADTNSTFDAIKNYVEKYNELITRINEKTAQPVYRDFKPLSVEERESLSEKQIEQWEEKARSGLLRNDSILSSGLSQMRMNFYEPVSGGGAFNQLAKIGISTGANYLDKGKLIIDEDKLRDAIEKDPTSVMNLFTANGDDKSSQGLARRLRESIGTTIQQIEARAGNSTRTNQQFTLGRELLNMDKRISTFEVRLQQKEARYWRQFTAMEKAINIANQQSVSIMSQFYNN